MAKTVITSATSFISASEALKRLDWRTLADLCADTGTRISSAADLQTDVNFLALLADASGMIEQACYAGGRYVREDIAAARAFADGLLALMRGQC